MYLDLINLDGINVKPNSFTYSILTYEKKKIAGQYETKGLYRSVILRNNQVVCYSPPKSISPEVLLQSIRLSIQILLFKNLSREP